MREPTKVATVAQIAALPGIREVSAGSVYNSTPLGLPGAIAIAIATACTITLTIITIATTTITSTTVRRRWLGGEKTVAGG